MYYLNYFKIGDRIDILMDAEGGKSKYLVSQVIDIDDEVGDEYKISVPTQRGVLHALPDGVEIDLYYYADSRGIYYFKAKILGKSKGVLPYYKIKQLSDTKKIQRRDHFRLSLQIPIEVYNKRNEFILDGYTEDISGGGLRFYSDKEFKEGEHIFLDFKLESDDFYIEAVVARSSFDSQDLRKYDIAARFLDIGKNNQNKIVEYIFIKQRNLIKKGMMNE